VSAADRLATVASDALTGLVRTHGRGVLVAVACAAVRTLGTLAVAAGHPSARRLARDVTEQLLNLADLSTPADGEPS
jgi:hypothetical protein